MLRPTLIALILSAVFGSSLVLCGPVVQQGDSWLIKIVPANQYEGVLEAIVVLDDGTQHSFVLPSKKYVPDVITNFKVQMRSKTGNVQMIFLRTHGVCPMGVLPLKVLRIRQIEIQSTATGDGAVSYSKYVNDLAVKDLCQNVQKKGSPGTAITDLDTSNADECVVDGTTYQNGHTFNIGCQMRCLCRDGKFTCISSCPPLAWSPDRNCKAVHVPGKCCEEVRCDDEEPMKQCATPTPTGGAATQQGSVPGPVTTHQYPWAVWICVDEACSQHYGGVIIGKWHILFFGPDLSTFKKIRFIAGQYLVAGSNQTNFSPIGVSRVVSHMDFVNTNSPIADSAPRLQVLHTTKAIPFSAEVQPANLPINKAQCARFTGLTSPMCPMLTVGWDIIQLGQDQDKREWFLHIEPSKLDQATSCNPAPTSTPRGDKRACLTGSSRQDCTGPMGGAIVATAGKTDFLCGLLDPDADMVKCVKPGTATVLPLCKYIDWITTLTTAAS